MRRRSVWTMTRPGKAGCTRYYLRWYDRGRMRTEAIGTSERLAEKKRCEREWLINEGLYSGIEPIRLCAFMEQHLTLVADQVRPGTVATQRGALKRFAAFAGDRPLESLSPQIVERWFAERLGRVRRATANKELRTLRGVFQKAVRRGYLRENPFAAVKAAREAEPDVRVLTMAEIEALLEACDSAFWRAFVVTALTTGMRSGEMAWLEWEDVDFEGGAIEVRCKDAHPTKGARNRTAPLVPLAAGLLADLKASRVGSWVFPRADGAQWKPWQLVRAFQAVARRAGIAKATIQMMRSTFVSHLHLAGVNAAVAQRLVGHASITTTQRHYSKILPDGLREAPGRLAWLRHPRIVEIVQKSYRGAESAVAARERVVRKSKSA